MVSALKDLAGLRSFFHALALYGSASCLRGLSTQRANACQKASSEHMPCSKRPRSARSLPAFPTTTYLPKTSCQTTTMPSLELQVHAYQAPSLDSVSSALCRPFRSLSANRFASALVLVMSVVSTFGLKGYADAREQYFRNRNRQVLLQSIVKSCLCL